MRNIESLLIKYTKLNAELTSKKKQLKEYKEQIADYMHKRKINKLILPGYNDILYKCEYQSRSTRSVDYSLLAENITNLELYNQIVQLKKSVALSIRKAPKKETPSKTNILPIEEQKESPDIPMGELS